MKNFNFKWLLLSIILSVAGISQVWGANASSARIYFDNTSTNWSNYVQILGGYDSDKGSHSSGSALSKISNTNNLWTGTWSWSGYAYFYFLNAEGSWEDNNEGPWGRKGSSYAHTSTRTDNLGSDTYLYVPNSGNNSGFSTAAKQTNGYSDLNYTQTLEQKLSEDGGTTYSASTATLATTVKVSSFYLNSATTATSTGDQAISSGYSSTTCSAARTATVTYTVSGVQSGYDFVGWYDGDTELSTRATYDYQATGAKTITARFKVHQYAVTYGVYANARHGSVSLNSGSAVTTSTSEDVNHGTTLTFTATPATGYSVVGWYSDAECTLANRLQEGGDTYDGGTLTAAKTVYVKFDAALTLRAGTGGLVSDNNSDWADEVTIEGIDDDDVVNIYTQANSGYVFNEWQITSGTGTITTNAELGEFTADSYNDVTLTATFTETKYAVTVNGGVASTSEVGIATSVTVTAAPAPAGKKFKAWEISGRYRLLGAQTSRVLELNATSDITLTATYEDRETKKVYFAKPGGWSKVCVHTWEASNLSNINEAWPGVEITSNTEEIAGTTYHYYEFYVDNDNEATPDDKSSCNSWDKIIFNNGDNSGVEQSTKTSTLDLVNGHFYHLYDNTGENGRPEATASGSTSPEDWYVVGKWNNSNDWGFSHPISMNGGDEGTAIVKNLSTSYTQEFKIYQSSTNTWYNCSSAFSLDTDLELTTGGGNTTFQPSETAAFSFTLNTESSPTIHVRKLTDINCSVTVTAAAHGSITTGPSTIHQYVSTAIVASANPGYRFKNWTVDAAHSAYITFEDATNKSTNVFATGPEASGAVITANFTNEGFVYIDISNKPSGWGDDVWVTYFNSTGWEWTNEGALKVMNWLADDVHNQKMTRIGSSNIYYFYTPRTPEGKILFVNKSHPGAYYELYQMAAAERGDFNVGHDNMFVLENYNMKPTSPKETGYYTGYWMKYEEETPGVKLCIYNGSHEHICGSPFTLTKDEAGYFTTLVNLTANTTYKIELQGDNGTYYKNGGTITGDISNWEYLERNKTVGCINTTGEGEYKFTLNCTNQLKLSVEYPLKTGDYRVVYNGKVTTVADSNSDRPSGSISKWTSGTQTDKVSFFVTDAEAGGMDWTLRIQSYNGSTWSDVEGKTGITISDLNGKTGVYTFDVTQTSASDITISNPQIYTGNFYIRTDRAKGGWEAYKTEEDNKMVYSDYAEENSGYNYYHCHYVPSGKNAKFTIANDYNPHITTEYTTDTYVSNEYGDLPANANVRFMYNSATNVISRAYLGGSSDVKFLVLEGDEKLFDSNGDPLSISGLSVNQINFTDVENFVYECIVKAQPNAQVKLTARYNSLPQYFKGSAESTETLIGGEGSTKYNMRIVYDFKTNRLVTAWLPSSLSKDLSIDADVMLIRDGQGRATQITLGDHTLSDVKTLYCVMRFNRWVLSNRDGQDNLNPEDSKNESAISTNHPELPSYDSDWRSRYERGLYWISFPFDVNLNEVFGSLGTYGKHWIIEYYDGLGRATNGFWADSPSNWKFITDVNTTLNAYEGYILALDLDSFAYNNPHTWANNIQQVELYFPYSQASAFSLQTKNLTVSDIPQTGYQCQIDRRTDKTEPNTNKDRRVVDSYWHCIGTPSFHDVSQAITTGENPTNPGAGGNISVPEADFYWEPTGKLYLYEWNANDNTLSVKTSGTPYSFKSMWSYLVQYSGTSMSWTSVSKVEPNPSVAARVVEQPDREYNFVLKRDSIEQDHTYVRLTDDANVTNGFEFNYDLCKEQNGGKGNIWTVTTDVIPVAGNSMPKPLQTTLVPVGVKVAANGEYTLSMPEGTNGEDVYLIDNAYGTRTNLGLMPYTVTLTAGTYDSRFALEFGPIQDAPTGIEQMSTVNYQLSTEEVRKVFVGGRLYIIRDGKVYDAAGQRVE